MDTSSATIETRDDAESAVGHDRDLRALLRFHREAPGRRSRAAGPVASPLVSPLLAAFRDLRAIRYDFPVVLVEGGGDPAVASLAQIIDGRLDEVAAPAVEAAAAPPAVYRLEAAIKGLAEEKPGRRLSELWPLAEAQLLQGTEDEERRERLRRNLAAAGKMPALDGRLLPFGPGAAREIVAHAWHRARSRQALGERRMLDDLIARLGDVLEADRARARPATAPDALRDAMGDEHAGGIDFEELAGVLRGARHYHALPGARRKRIRNTLKELRTARSLLPPREGNGLSGERRRRRPAPCSSCGEAIVRIQAALGRRVELSRAVRVATLEQEGHYDPAQHDPYFANFDAGGLTPEEYQALPPLLVCLDGNTLDDAEKAALIEILASDMPVKVLLELERVPGRAADVGSRATHREWTDQLGVMAMALGGAFVLQTAASHLPGLASRLVDGLDYHGPALFCIYAGPAKSTGGVPAYLHCASAVESRAFPSFVYDPGRGTDLASRFSLEGSPQVDRVWPEHELAYEDRDGRAVNDAMAFTCVDFLALDPRFAEHFAEVAPSDDYPELLPVARYLELEPEAAADKVPFLFRSDHEDRLGRVAVQRPLVAYARNCAAAWRTLQELAGIRNSHAVRLLAEERGRLEEEQRRVIDELEAAYRSRPGGEAVATEAPEATPEGSPTPVPAGDEPVVEAPEAAAGGDRAYIDTALCTSCDDCIERNDMMFAYDESKQAFIKDAAAGTYRELVEAAENCPVCIIHPGKPTDTDEPGLEALVERAAAFS